MRRRSVKIGAISCGLAALLALRAPPAVRAEVFLLATGGRLEGQLLNPDQQPRESYDIQTTLGRLQLAASQVRRVIPLTDAQRNYQKYLTLMPDTLEGNWKMAEWCRQAGLERERQEHLEAVLEFDHNHEKARHGLGYTLGSDGDWQLSDVIHRTHGFIRYEGRWQLPEDILLQRMEEERELESKELRRHIKMWREWMIKGRGKEAEGRQRLLTLDNPLAADGVSGLLDEEEEPQALKLLYIEVLGRLRSPVGALALIRRALEDPDAKIRNRSLEQLAKFDTQRAVAAFTAALRSKDNVQVNRAAAGLAMMKDDSPQTILALIDALITEHKFQVRSGAGLNPTFSGSGGGTFGVGGKPKIIKRDLQNENVRKALTALLGVSHGFDEEAWRQWYVRQNLPQATQLRRSE